MKPSDNPSAQATQQMYHSLRVLRTVALSELGVIAALVVLIFLLFPLKEKDLIVLDIIDGQDDVVEVHRAGKDVTVNHLLHIAYLRKYIIARETIDKSTEGAIRYPVVKAMSSQKVFQIFQTLIEHPQSLYHKKGFMRSIAIKRHEIMQPGYAQIEFETTEWIEDDPRKIRRYFVATLQYTFMAQKTPEKLTLNNPIGLIITTFNASEREN